MIGRVSRVCLARSLVHYAYCDFSKSTSPIFMKFGTVVQHLRHMSLLTFERSRSNFKVTTAVMKIFHLQ